jgi:hypothetical protein
MKSLRGTEGSEMSGAVAIGVARTPIGRELAIDFDPQPKPQDPTTLGYPLGITAARVITTILSLLRLRNDEVGLETMCVDREQGRWQCS